MVETTAFGAAALAGLSCGVWSGLEELTRLRRSQRVFLPTRPQADCDRTTACGSGPCPAHPTGLSIDKPTALVYTYHD